MSSNKKLFMVHCDFCGKKTVMRDPSQTQGLTEIPNAAIPGGIPLYDPEKKQIVNKPSIPRRKMYKCTQCGRGVVVRNNYTPIELTPEEVEKEKQKREKDLSTGREAGPFGQPVP